MRSEPLLITAPDAAALLGVSLSSVWRYAKAGILPAPIKIGGSTRFRRDQVLAAVGLLREPPRRPAPTTRLGGKAS